MMKILLSSHQLTLLVVGSVLASACAPTPAPTAAPAAGAPAAAAQPARPVEFVISTEPGGGSDIYARFMQLEFGQAKVTRW